MTAPTTDRWRLMSRVISVGVPVVVLVFVPTWGSAFVTSKALLACGVALISLLIWLKARRPIAVDHAVLLALASLSVVSSHANLSSLLFLATAVCIATWSALALQIDSMRWAARTGFVVAVVTCAQALRLDPFAWWQPQTTGPRMVLYGTLGNPDFVASVLVVTILVSFSLRRFELVLSVVLQSAALALTHSFASIASSVAALVVWRRGREGIAVLLVVMAVSVLMIRGRSLESAISGRVYLLKVAGAHVLDKPLLGYGRDAVEALWPEWEVELWKARCADDATCVAQHDERRFAALQNHVHNDVVELAIEGGLPLLLAWVVVLARAFRKAFKNTATHGSWVAAALAASSVRALVDFPWSRPADLMLLALLVAWSHHAEVSANIEPSANL